MQKMSSSSVNPYRVNLSCSQSRKERKNIKKRAESIQNNLNNFDKDIQKEKDNSRYR